LGSWRTASYSSVMLNPVTTQVPASLYIPLSRAMEIVKDREKVLAKKHRLRDQQPRHLRMPTFVFSTVHHFKGGECDVTILADDVDVTRKAAIEDEERTKYVAVTRARWGIIDMSSWKWLYYNADTARVREGWQYRDGVRDILTLEGANPSLRFHYNSILLPHVLDALTLFPPLLLPCSQRQIDAASRDLLPQYVENSPRRYPMPDRHEREQFDPVPAIASVVARR
jgi:hypothetical protein